MFCTQCGYAAPDGSTQCTACGAKLASGFAAPPIQNPYLSPPQAGGQNPYAGKPDNNLVLAIITTLMCCLPFGIVAIVYASQVDSKWFSGDRYGAMQAAKNAKAWGMAALFCGLIPALIWLVLVVVGAASGGMR